MVKVTRTDTSQELTCWGLYVSGGLVNQDQQECWLKVLLDVGNLNEQ